VEIKATLIRTASISADRARLPACGSGVQLRRISVGIADLDFFWPRVTFWSIFTTFSRFARVTVLGGSRPHDDAFPGRGCRADVITRPAAACHRVAQIALDVALVARLGKSTSTRPLAGKMNRRVRCALGRCNHRFAGSSLVSSLASGLLPVCPPPWKRGEVLLRIRQAQRLWNDFVPPSAATVGRRRSLRPTFIDGRDSIARPARGPDLHRRGLVGRFGRNSGRREGGTVPPACSSASTREFDAGLQRDGIGVSPRFTT
jgi:hypothetical protein